MACVKCEYLGYVETYVRRDAGFRPMVAQCQSCKDTAAYSRRIQYLLNETELVQDFPPQPPPPVPAKPRQERRLTLVK